MNILLQQPTIIAPNTVYHFKQYDVLLQNGTIKAIDNGLNTTDAYIIKAHNYYLSIGWLDVGTQVGEPGLEHREDLQSVSKAAMAGGFTAIANFPNTQPVIHSRTEVNYLKRFAERSLLDIFPIGAISKNCAGEEMAELYDMHDAGAVAFSDGKYSVMHNLLLTKALQYVNAFDGLIINYPNQTNLAPDGQIHEGRISTQLGLSGIPSIAEEMAIMRDLTLLEYTGSKLHFHNISTAKSVDLIKAAKEKGLNVSASVAIMNLVLTDKSLLDFDTNYKVLPPLRELSDVEALKHGLKEGVIDFITTNHTPLEVEVKAVEFPYASFGAIGLETAYALSNMHLGRDTDVSQEQLVQWWAYHPRKRLGLDIPEISVGSPANLTLFDPHATWVYKEDDIQSKSKNSPFLNQTLRGKVVAVFNKRQWMSFL
jgi:dihydroorotase